MTTVRKAKTEVAHCKETRISNNPVFPQKKGKAAHSRLSSPSLTHLIAQLLIHLYPKEGKCYTENKARVSK